MSDYLSRFFGLVFNIFGKEKRNPFHRNIQRHPSRYCTPLVGRSRAPLKGRKPSDVSIQRFSSCPSMMSHDQLPLQRHASQISLPRCGRGTPMPSRLKREPAKRNIDKPYPALPENPVINKLPSPDFYPTNVPKSSHSFETCSVADDWIDAEDVLKAPPNLKRNGNSNKKPLHPKDPTRVTSELERPAFYVRRLYQPRIQHYPQIGLPSKCKPKSTKIPIKLPGSKYKSTAKARFVESNGYHRNGVIGDCARSRCSDIGNWITYRNDTSVLFEHTFKMLSRKKHTIGNMIDATIHSQWLRLAGIYADEDARMFKEFAGGKIILTIGEYKFLISNICILYDLDYWDVIRKMAIIQKEDNVHEVL